MSAIIEKIETSSLLIARKKYEKLKDEISKLLDRYELGRCELGGIYVDGISDSFGYGLEAYISKFKDAIVARFAEQEADNLIKKLSEIEHYFGREEL